MKSHITAHIIANEIRLERGVRKETVFTIVEGTDDARLYKGFVDQERCIFKVAHCRFRVLAAARLFGPDDGVVGIVDADEYPLLQEEEFEPNQFRTDGHDAETMMIQSEAFDKLVRHTADEPALRKFLEMRESPDLRDVLLEVGVPLGCLRLINKRDGLQLRFKGLCIEGFVDRKSLVLDRSGMVNAVCENSRNRTAGSERQLLSEVEAIEKATEQVWLLASGHDLCRIFCIALRECFGHRRYMATLSTDEVEKQLRLAYETAHFRKSELYRSLAAWQRHTGAPAFLL